MLCNQSHLETGDGYGGGECGVGFWGCIVIVVMSHVGCDVGCHRGKFLVIHTVWC